MQWLENQFDWCKYWLIKFPILASIVMTAGVFMFYLLMVGIANIAGMRGFGVARGCIRLAASVPAIVIIGILIQQNGFKFAFSVKNSAKALLICAPLILALFLAPLQLIGQADLNSLFDTLRLIRAFANISTGVFEEVLLRGLFMIAMLCRFGDTKTGRLLVVLACALVFGVGHPESLFMVFAATMYGVIFGAAFAYSGNLLVVMAVHAFNNFVSGLIYTSLYPAANTMWFPFFWLYSFTLPDAIFLLAFVALIAYAIIKAEPFSKRFSLIKWIQ